MFYAPHTSWWYALTRASIFAVLDLRFEISKVALSLDWIKTIAIPVYGCDGAYAFAGPSSACLLHTRTVGPISLGFDGATSVKAMTRLRLHVEITRNHLRQADVCRDNVINCNPGREDT